MEASVADLSAQGEKVEEALEEAPSIPGSGQQLTLTVGGNKVDVSEFKLQGGSIAVEGQFAKGEKIRLVVEATVGKVEFEDTHDHVGTVVKTTRRHIAKIDAVRRSPSEA